MRHNLKQRLKRTAVFLAASMLIVNLMSSVGRNNVLALDNELTDIASIELLEFYTTDENNQHLSLLNDSQTEVAYNADRIFARIKWTFPDGDDRVEIVKDQTYVYPLPDKVSFTDYNGPLLHQGDPVGQYEISGNNLYITYTDQTFCNRLGRNSEVTFSGVITGDTSSSDLDSEVVVTFPGGPDPVTVKMVIPPVSYLTVNKDNRTLVSDSDHRYRYVATVTSHGDNTDVEVKDWTTMGLYIDTSTVGIYTDAGCTSAYTGSYTTDNMAQTGFQYTFASMSDGETIYIGYEVTIDGNLYNRSTAETFVGDSGAYGSGGYHGNVTNTIEAISEEAQTRAIDYNDIGTYNVYMNKYHEGTDEDSGIIRWTIYVYGIPASFDDGYIVDTLPENTVYVPGSVYVNYWGDDHTEDVRVDTSTAGKLTFYLDDQDLLSYLKNVSGANLQITYSVRITEQTAQRVVYTNNAKLYFDGDQVDEATADTAFELPQILSKIGEYDESTAPYATFTITVNPLGLNVDTAAGHDTLTLTDVFPEAYDLQVSSVVITRNDAEALTTESFGYTESTRTLTLELLDNTPYTIRYRALVNRRVGSQLDEDNSKNVISMPDVSPDIGDNYYFQCIVVTSAGAASAYDPDIATLNVIKHASGDTTNVLEGAQFALTPMTVGASNTVTAGTAVTKDTDENGIASFDVLREKVYMLSETQAPDGYKADTDVYFYAFANDTSAIPASVSYNGQTYTVTIIESDRVSRDIYFANELAGTEDTDPPEDPADTDPVTPDPATPETPVSADPITLPTDDTSGDQYQVGAVTTPAASTPDDTDPNNSVNGKERGTASEQASNSGVATTGQRISFSNITGTIIVFASFQILTYLRIDRRRAMLEQEEETE